MQSSVNNNSNNPHNPQNQQEPPVNVGWELTKAGFGLIVGMIGLLIGFSIIACIALIGIGLVISLFS